MLWTKDRLLMGTAEKAFVIIIEADCNGPEYSPIRDISALKAYVDTQYLDADGIMWTVVT